MSHKVVEYLKQWKGENDTTLHQHLCEMLTQMDDTLNALPHFQRLSDYFKRVQFQPQQPHTQEEIQHKNNQEIAYPQWILKEEHLMESAKKHNNMKEKNIQNFQQHAATLFQPLGINFKGEENYRIGLCLKKLAQKENCTSLRFWGKILTTNGDYLVMQGVALKKKDPIVTGDMEKYREGANYYSYWVSHESIGDDWYELPLISPAQLQTAKLIKHIFTGNLMAPVTTYPKFEGQERHLLKAQLVRITHNCQISPKGLYATLEDNAEEIEFAEQFKMPEFNELTNLESWVHTNPYLLQMGRATHVLDASIPEAQREEAMGKLVDSDQKIQRLKAINEDKPVEGLGMEGCWVARANGNLQLFNNVGKEEGTTSCYGVVSLKNPHWPGWVTAANMKGFASIYIGYGYKLTQKCFHPMAPEDMLVEGEDVEEFGEPNPKDPPDELQPDSDDENKKPQE